MHQVCWKEFSQPPFPNHMRLLPECRVPIIKCYLRPPGFNQSCPADISLHTQGGVDAAQIISNYIIAMPPVKPLTFVLKRLLKVRPYHMFGMARAMFATRLPVFDHLDSEVRCQWYLLCTYPGCLHRWVLRSARESFRAHSSWFRFEIGGRIAALQRTTQKPHIC